MAMLRAGVGPCGRAPAAAATKQQAARQSSGHYYQFGYKSKDFMLEPGADKKHTSIYWGDHMFEENMAEANKRWHNPLPSSVPSQEEFGCDTLQGSGPHAPPGAYAGVNRPWVGHKPSRVTSGHYGSGLAIRDTWGPDAEYTLAESNAKPEVLIKRVSVDWFLDEFSNPMNKTNTVMESCVAKHTRNYRINAPEHDNMLDRLTTNTLLTCIARSTHAIGRRITMVGAVQNGKTEWFCRGLPLSHFARKLRWVVSPPESPSKSVPSADAGQVDRLAEALLTQRNTPDEAAERSELAAQGALHGHGEDAGGAIRMVNAAARQAAWLVRLDESLPTHPLSPPDAVHTIATDVRRTLCLIHALAKGESPTISFVNGKAHNVGAGIALFCNYAALRDEAELTYNGGSAGTTPIGGLLRLFRDDVVDIKYPGLGEYIMLTGDKLCSGDAKRLGWTAVHAPTDIHLNERMLHDYMNMHGQGDYGNATRILHSALFNDADGSLDADRCAVSATKAAWIREAFHEKKSVAEIKAALDRIALDPASEQSTDAEVHVAAPADGSEAADSDKTERRGLTKAAWAACCLALMDRYSPFTQAVSLAMLRKAREEELPLLDCLQLEYRCFMRTLTRPDFITAQLCTGNADDSTFPNTADRWDAEKGCPVWSPRTDADVSADEVARVVSTPLSWSADGTTELHLEVETTDHVALKKACIARGIEVVEGLGETTATADTAALPQNVNVYREARHPQTGAVGSRREDEVNETQQAHRARLLREAAHRLSHDAARQYDRETGELNGARHESRVEEAIREGALRWDNAEVAAVRASCEETSAMLDGRVDPGGAAVLSPDGAQRHEQPFAPKKLSTYGYVADHRVNILTHLYSPSSGMQPQKVRNWPAVDRLQTSLEAQGKTRDQILQLALNADL